MQTNQEWLESRKSSTEIPKLLKSQWWQWPVSAWDETDPRDISAFIDRATEVRETLLPMPELRMTANELIAGLAKPAEA